LDIDGNGAKDALTDSLLLLRYLFGFRGTTLVGGAIGPNATRPTAVAVEQFINGNLSRFDIDGNGASDALTDGLLAMRYLFGFRGATLTNGAIGSGATRTTPSAIESYIAQL